MNNTFCKDKVAVVTGASGVLCSQIAVCLAQKGAKVVLIGRNAENLQKVSDTISSFGGESMVEPCDVTDEDGIIAVSKRVMNKCGKCNYLINGAGGNNPKAITTNYVYDEKEILPNKPADMVGFFNINLSTFEDVLRINTIGTLIPCHVFGKQMAKAGEGNIINFASMNSYRPLSRIPAYAMSKAAIVNFTEWMACYFASAGIRVNAIAPGFFVNERSKKILYTPEGDLSQRGKNVISHTPMRRFGDSKELLGCVEWLLDNEKSSFVTGTTIPIDGGFRSQSGV